MNLLQHHGIRKEPRFNCKKYLAWIATQRCIISGLPCEQVHHTIYKSAGNNASDLFCVPLTAKYHAEYHSVGREEFERRHMIDMEEVVASFLQRYCEERGVDLRANLLIYIEELIKAI